MIVIIVDLIMQFNAKKTTMMMIDTISPWKGKNHTNHGQNYTYNNNEHVSGCFRNTTIKHLDELGPNNGFVCVCVWCLFV